MESLSELIDKLSAQVKYHDKINTTISSASVGWHIAHSTLVIKQIIEQLEKSDSTNYKWKFNTPRFFVFLMNKIPRGKGKAPKAVQIDEVFTVESLHKYLIGIKEKTLILSGLDKNKNFTHPYFGMLNLKHTIKTLQIHTKHHIEIINDIVK
jgi:hypothetical protein